MKTYLDCIPCFLNQALRATRIATSDEAIQRKTMDLVLQILPTLPLESTPPEIALEVYKIVYYTTANHDPYAEIKRESNQLALSLYPKLKNIIETSLDPLLTTCKLSIAGNCIDFGPQEQYGDLETEIASALESPLAIDFFEKFKKTMEASSQVLYLGDNAGEILFDKIMIEQLNRDYNTHITYVVRDKPIINDATMEDAIAVGLTDIVDVISNGSIAPATVLNQCSEQFLKLFEASDLIIAKGQGNYESLSNENSKIFFFLKAKCALVANQLNAKIGDMILLNQ